MQRGWLRNAPVLGVVGNVKRVADAGGCSADPVVPWQFQVKHLVHASCEDHIRVNEDHAVVPFQPEHSELGPRVVEPGERRVEPGMLLLRGGEVFDVDDLHALVLNDLP